LGENFLIEHSENGTEVLLRLADIQRTYQMGEVSVEVLKHVSLDIRRGEVLAIVAPDTNLTHGQRVQPIPR
jgi:ABC-type glutathione transport system ATPase component